MILSKENVLKKKLLMYILYHYEGEWADEKDITDAIEKDDWFKMDTKELERRYGDRIKQIVKKMQCGDKK